MNYTEQVAQMLGVEMGEKFRIKEIADHKFYINKNGLQCETSELFMPDYFSDLITGKYEIVKISKRKHTGLEDLEEGDEVYPLFGFFDEEIVPDNTLYITECFSDKEIRDNWERYIDIKKRLAKAASELNNEPIDWNDDNKKKWYISCDPQDNNNLVVDYIYKGPEDAIYFNKAGAAKKAIEIVGEKDLIWMLRDFQPFIGYSTEVTEDE